jgi:hypothetical protein
MERRKMIKALLTFGAASTTAGLSMLSSARVGRPATPGSVAGVRRRTRRRTRRRVYAGMRLTTLPCGCSATRVAGGITYNYCGGIWYQPSYSGTTVVYVVHEIDPGADTNVEFEEYD